MPRILLLLALLLIPCSNSSAQTPPQLRDLNTHCPFTVPTSKSAWTERAADVRLQLNVALGLYPQIELPPVQPEIYGRIEREGYTIERIAFDSLPGFKVTGSLYLPSDVRSDQTTSKASIPGILCPHGHWPDARFETTTDQRQRELIAIGAERFASGAANPIQARCVQLARMGCAALHWDLMGYSDSHQISLDRAHRFASQPAETEVTDEGWLLFSPMAESNTQSILGLQALAVRRATDAILSLPFVDPNRIAITGASGGATQSFLGAALDERIAVAFPVVMVSTGMQGGCTCENCSLLRTGTGNVEMAALIAPRPLGLTAADDWTRTMPEDGFPELQSLYDLYGAKDKVQLFPVLHFGHSYNHVSRTSMYGWMNQHLGLGFDTPVLESSFEIATKPELTLWDKDHPAPAGGLEFERKLLKDWSQRTDAHFDALDQDDQALSKVLIDGWRVCLGLTAFPLPAASHPADELALSNGQDGSWTVSQVESTQDTGVSIHVTAAGTTTIYHFEGIGNSDQDLVKNPRLAAAYTYGFNLPHFATQARRLASSIELAEQLEPTEIKLVARGADAALAAAAIVCRQQTFDHDTPITLELAPEQFRFATAKSIRSPSFLPGAAKFRDFDGLLACIKSTTIKIAGSNQDYRFTKQLSNFNQTQLSE